MKKFFVFLFFISISLNNFAQNSKPYNKWSLDFGIGAHDIIAPISSGYMTSAPGFGYANIGFRYMFNSNFGLRANLGYHEFTEAPDTNPFKANYYRTSLEAVANIGSLLKFRRFTNRFNLLAYAGGGTSSLTTITPNDVGPDNMTNLIFGVTPQFKLSNKISLFADVSTIFHQMQDFTYNGATNSTPDDVTNSLLNFGLGVNVALGSKEEHADFYSDDAPRAPRIKKPKVKKEKKKKEKKPRVRKEKKKKEDAGTTLSKREQRRLEKEKRRANKQEKLDPEDEIENLKERLAKAEDEIETLKSNESSNPNKELIMTELDERYVKREEVESGKYASRITGGNVSFVRELLNRGYVNVYFDTNKTEIQAGSIYAINYLKEFLNDNPYFRATLIGYADESGSIQANQRLSERRAKAVFDILVDAGVSPSRMTYAGAGIDSSVGEKARQLARRVTFKIIQ